MRVDGALVRRARAEVHAPDNERLRSELAERKAAHGAALVMRRATAAAPSARYPAGASRAIALTGLLVILVSLALAIGLVIV